LDIFPLFQAGALDKLEAFTSFSGPDFYGLPRNTSKIALRKSPWKVPATYTYSSGEIVPMFTGSTLEWLPSDQTEE
jgi:dihydroorotase